MHLLQTEVRIPVQNSTKLQLQWKLTNGKNRKYEMDKTQIDKSTECRMLA